MDSGRQRLSQRRKAAALAQGSRADLLAPEPAPERVTVVRQEVREAEPPPQARSHVASTPQVSSTPQLAELFTDSKAGATRAPSLETAALAPEVKSGRWKFPVLIRPWSSRIAIPGRPRRPKRFPAAGLVIAALAGGAASILWNPPRSVPIPPPDAAETPALTAPVAVIPAPDPASNPAPHTQDAIGAAHSAPAKEPDKPAEAAISSWNDSVPRPPDTQGERRIPIRHKPAPSTVAPPHGTRPTPAEAYDAWSRAAGLNANDHRWERLRSEPLPPR